jgi:hypothetical protein
MAATDTAISRTIDKIVEHVSSGECILFLGAAVHAWPPEGSGYGYRDATLKLARQRQELSRLVGEGGGLTGGQVSQLSERFDDYAAAPVRWE